MRKSGHDDSDHRKYAEQAALDAANRAHRPAHYGIYRFASILLMVPSLISLALFWGKSTAIGEHPVSYAVAGVVVSLLLWRKSRELT